MISFSNPRGRINFPHYKHLHNFRGRELRLGGLGSHDHLWRNHVVAGVGPGPLTSCPPRACVVGLGKGWFPKAKAAERFPEEWGPGAIQNSTHPQTWPQMCLDKEENIAMCVRLPEFWMMGLWDSVNLPCWLELPSLYYFTFCINKSASALQTLACYYGDLKLWLSHWV